VTVETEKYTGGKSPAVRRRFQEGNWRCRNGVWSCKYREYVQQVDGTYKVADRGKSFPGLSERAARAAMKPTLDAVNKANGSEAQFVVPMGAPTVIDAVADWRKLVAPHRKPRGVETTESHLKAHILPQLGQVALCQLNVRRVQEFVNKISPGRSGKMVENVLLTLTGILRHASKWNEDIKPVNISDLTMPPKEKSKPRFLSGREIKKLITASRGVFRTILLVLALTGMRINEVLGLRVEDVDFDNRLIHVTKSAYNGTLGTPKSDASAADIPLSATLAKALRGHLHSKHYRENPLGVLFANRRLRPFSDNKLREKSLRPLLRSLEMKQVGFHAIRHGVASELLNSGTSIVVVRDQMRHSDVRVTLGIYGHVVGNAQRKAVDVLSRIMTGKSNKKEKAA
jgi:integrase